MKKTISLICFLVLLSAFLFSCGKEEGKRYDFDLSEYVSLKMCEKVEAKFAPLGVCTEEELDNAVFQILLTYGDEVEKDSDTVEIYDAVVVEYNLYYEGKVLEDYYQEEYPIIVGYEGNSGVDTALSEGMLGKRIGETCRVKYTFPKNDVNLGSWAGKTVECTGKILSVKKIQVPECTDEFVAKIGDGYTSVESFRKTLKEDILKQREEQKAAAVLNAFMDGVTVKKYPEMETQGYVDRYIAEIAATAETLGLSYEDYLSEYLNLTEDQVSQAAYEDAKDRVKKEMACIQASRILKVKLSEKEYKEGLEKYYASEKDLFESIEEFEAHYTKEVLWECIRWDKTFLVMLENAVSVK